MLDMVFSFLPGESWAVIQPYRISKKTYEVFFSEHFAFNFLCNQLTLSDSQQEYLKQRMKDLNVESNEWIPCPTSYWEILKEVVNGKRNLKRAKNLIKDYEDYDADKISLKNAIQFIEREYVSETIFTYFTDMESKYVSFEGESFTVAELMGQLSDVVVKLWNHSTSHRGEVFLKASLCLFINGFPLDIAIEYKMCDEERMIEEVIVGENTLYKNCSYESDDDSYCDNDFMDFLKKNIFPGLEKLSKFNYNNIEQIENAIIYKWISCIYSEVCYSFQDCFGGDPMGIKICETLVFEEYPQIATEQDIGDLLEDYDSVTNKRTSTFDESIQKKQKYD